LFNVEGERGSIGRVPPYLAHRFSPALVKFDAGKGEPIRNEEGFCVRCAPGEIGEAIGPVRSSESNTGSRFEGYTDPSATEKNLLRSVFETGDVWVRTGDLMRIDTRGFFYFADRTGDTYRWKGENVATTEISAAILAFPGISHASVYGVAIPFTDGRAGMAALVAERALDLHAFRRYLTDRLPRYALPLFLRIRDEMKVTETWKYSKIDLVEDGYDPAATADAIYFNDPETNAFVRVDRALYDRLQTGGVRV
jgi:fatty-acyl-CoA synthase